MKAELKRRFSVIILFVSFVFFLFILIFIVLGLGKKKEKVDLNTESSHLAESAEIFSINLLDENSSENFLAHTEISSNISFPDKNNLETEDSLTVDCQIEEEINLIVTDQIEQKRQKSLQLQNDSASNKLTNPSFSENKIKASAAAGVSPVYFHGNNFINSYFPKQTFIFLPCLTLSVIFPSKTGWNCGIIFQGSGSKLEHNIINYSNETDLITSTQFFTFQTSFMLQRKVFSSKNLFELHAGLGLAGFFNSTCQLGNIKSSPAQATRLLFNCGLSLKHNFSKNTFCCLSFNFNYAFLPAEAFFFFEPSITGGVLI